MKLQQFEIGLPVSIGRCAYRVQGFKKASVVFRSLDGGREETLSYEEIARKYADGSFIRGIKKEDLTPEDYAAALNLNYRGLSEVDRRHAEKLQPYIKAFVERGCRHHAQRNVIEELIAGVAAEHELDWQPNWRTLSDHIGRFLKARSQGHVSSDSSWLLTEIHARGNRTAKYPAELEAYIDGLIRDSLKPGGRSLKTVHSIVKNYVARQNLKKKTNILAPCRRTLERRRFHISQYDKMVLQHGKTKALQTCMPVKEGPRAELPLMEVEIDHHVVDLTLLSAVTNAVIGRPYLTVAIDRCTRVVLGYHLGFEPPSYHSMMLCLRMAMSPKDAWFKANSELKHDWPYGQMRRLICDNGLEFHGDNFKNFLKRFNMSVTWVKKKRGDDKGIVERLFERMEEELFHRMPGTTLSNPKAKGEYDSAYHATLTLRNLARIVECWLVNDYSISMHKGLNGRPLVEWKKMTEEFGVEVPPDTGVLNILLYPGEPRTLGREGVHVHGIKYGVDGNEDLFFEMLNHPLKPKVLPVKYDPSNLTYVYIEDWRVSGRFLRLKARTKEAWETSLVEWNYYTERARAAQKEDGRVYEAAIHEARVDTDRTLEQLKMTRKLRGHRFARLTEPTILPAPDVIELQVSEKEERHIVVVPECIATPPVADLPSDPYEFLRECDDEGVW